MSQNKGSNSHPLGFSGRAVLTSGKGKEKDKGKRAQTNIPVPASLDEILAVTVRLSQTFPGLAERFVSHFIRGWRIWWNQNFGNDIFAKLGKAEAEALLNRAWASETEMLAIMFDPKRRPGRAPKPRVVKIDPKSKKSVDEQLREQGFTVVITE